MKNIVSDFKRTNHAIIDVKIKVERRGRNF
jgi:hypothetical protein